MKYWSRHSFGTVSDGYDSGHYVHVKNEQGRTWTIDHSIFKEEFVVADEYTHVTKASRTKIIEAIMSAPYVAMKVCFRKKPNNKELAKQVVAKAGAAAFEKAIRTVLDNAGEEREMIGRHHGKMNEHGRLKFFDVEEQCWKQVDTLTIFWAIVKGTRYEIK